MTGRVVPLEKVRSLRSRHAQSTHKEVGNGNLPLPVEGILDAPRQRDVTED